MELSEIRTEIDRVDREILRLFEERMVLAGEVAETKRESGKPVFDLKRENEKLKTLSDLADSEFNKKAATELFRQIMSISRKYQYTMLSDVDNEWLRAYKAVPTLPVDSDTKVGYQGVEGAWSHIAARKHFGDTVRKDSFYTVERFEDLVKKVSSGELDYGVLPIENSSAGFVHGIFHMLKEENVSIVSSIRLPIRQALLGIPGAKIEDVQTVYSHPQALLQSAKYLSEHNWQQISFANTALSAKKICEDNNPSQAAVASAYAAELYGLEILEPCINDRKANETQFAILSREKMHTEDADHITISFSLPHESGTLYQILGHFIFNGLNMTSIESEPLGNGEWEYRFYITFKGILSDPKVQNALQGVIRETEQFKLLGNYQIRTEG